MKSINFFDSFPEIFADAVHCEKNKQTGNFVLHLKT